MKPNGSNRDKEALRVIVFANIKSELVQLAKAYLPASSTCAWRIVILHKIPQGSIVRAKEVRNVEGTYLLAVAQEDS